jgi:hypothetical protein
MAKLRLIVVLAVLAALAGCQAANNGPTYTVHGTSTSNDAGTGNSVITVTRGSNSYSVSVPVTSTSWTYSISGVPAGDYSASISYPMTGTGYGGYYYLNGDSTSHNVSSVEAAGIVTHTTGIITIDADLQLDMNTGVL